MPLKRVLLCFFAVGVFCLFGPPTVEANLQINEGEDGIKFARSIESLRDLDYQTWQVVVYYEDRPAGSVVLRVVGYPGTLRLEHPTSLKVHAGRRDWELEDITLSNSKLASDPRQAAAEFELSPLLVELDNNRPLRLMLPEVFTDLPVPPYVVGEWRSLKKQNYLDE